MSEARLLRVVVADESPLVRHLYAVMLDAEQDVAIIAAVSSVGDCVDDVQALEPDLVLIDVQLPGGGGHAAARAIAETSRAAIVLTNVAEAVGEVAVADAIAAGALTVIPKPTVQTLLDERQRKEFVATLWRAAAQGG